MWIGRSSRSRIITGLDIGTTKVCALIGEVSPDGALAIRGHGTYSSHGLRSGEIVEIQPTVDAIVHATSQAEEVAGVSIGELYVGIAGRHISSANSKAAVPIRSSQRGIDFKDRDRVIQKVRSVPLPEDRTLLHSVVQEFRVNGGEPTRNPVGLSGENLEVWAHLVMSSVNSVNNILRCVERAGLPTPTLVLQSLASTMSAMGHNDNQLGAVLVDIGGGTTDVAISLDGAVRWTGEVPHGGDLITRDIAKVLRCSINDAENVKKRHGCAVPDMVERGKTFEAPVAGDPGKLAVHEEYELAQIVEAALEDDILLEVRRIIDRSELRDRLSAGAIVTGGASLMPNVEDVVGRVLEMPCRRGAPAGVGGCAPVVGNPIYSTAVGLIRYGMSDAEQANSNRLWVRRLADWLVEHLI